MMPEEVQLMNFRAFKVNVKEGVKGFDETACAVLAIRDASDGTELLLPNKTNKLVWVKMNDVTVSSIYPKR